MKWLTSFIVSIFVGIGSLFGIHPHVATPPVSATPSPVVKPPTIVLPPVGTKPPTVTTVVISSITPLSGLVGSTVNIYGSGFLSTNTVLFGGGPIQDAVVSNNGTKLTFVVPSAVGADCKQGMACPMYARLITAGPYLITIRNTRGTSNAVTYTVTGGGTPIPQPEPQPVTVVPVPVVINVSAAATPPQSILGIVDSSFTITPPSNGGGGAAKDTSFSGSFTISSGYNTVYLNTIINNALTLTTNVAGVNATLFNLSPANGSQSNDASGYFAISPGSKRTFTFYGTLSNNTGSPVAAAAGISTVYITTEAMMPQSIPINYGLQGLNSDFHIQVLLGIN
ncbi:MAG: hypothetical protein WCQ60_00650 [bacterium]